MDKLNTILWAVATVLLIFCGLYYTFKLGFIQFDFKRMFKSLKKEKKDKDSISPIGTLTLALAARIGVGSLSGIALGIMNGGIGVIFWIWLSCLITLPNTLVESTLAVKYREKDGKFYKGGPAYYIKNGLNKKTLSIIYAIVICLCYLGGFLAIQSNTIASSIKDYLDVSPYLTGLIIAFICFFIICWGLKGITKFTSGLVPIMGLVYMGVCLFVIITNISSVPTLLLNIIKQAFNFKAFGWGIFSSMIIGVQRGIFSSESGIGTGAVASGTSDTNSPIKQGFLQMLGVYFTTFIVCTSTALIILLSDVDFNSFVDPNGIEITLFALNKHLGNFGNIILIFTIICFAFSTVISGYYYGESNLKFLFKKMNKKHIFILQICVMLILFIGAIMKPSSLWNLVDIGVAVLAIINIIAIFMLRKDMFLEYYNYKRLK